MLNLNSINVKEDKKEDKNLVVKKQSINKKKEKTESKNIEKVRLTTTSLTLQTVLAKIKKYYENGDYDDAINWCKIGSKINNKNDDIWSYYALSLYKRGEKEKAIKVLKTYLKYRKSQKIEKIIKRLK
jgi:tetratricopeptide (TPR) repeat protein